jgi:uncharacterized protein
VRFDWDPGKAKSNLAKHRVSFEEACEVFFDPFVITMEDDKHSANEDRQISIGIASKRRVLFVVHTLRDGDTVWIIGARKATKREVTDYEDEIKERLGDRE